MTPAQEPALQPRRLRLASPAAERHRPLRCPKCEDAVLDELRRGGVVIDVCRRCRGTWLDAGELEALVAAPAHPSRGTLRLVDPPHTPHR